MQLRFRSYFLCLILFMFSSYGWAQVVASGVQYKSDIDALLTISHVTLLPVIDNVNGIYSNPVEKKLRELLTADHRWGYVENNIVGNIPTERELEGDLENAKRLGGTLGVDAYLTCRVTKGPKGISLTMSLFNSKDGKLMLQEAIKEFTRFESQAVIDQAGTLLGKVFSRIPYEGRVLSRKDLKVTVNLGKKDGIKKDQVLTVIQVIKVNRHPKFNFLISAEKEIIGKIKVYKVDDTLSFGGIISEKEKGVVEKDSKIGTLKNVTYSNVDALGNDASEQELLEERPDSLIAFGGNPEAWAPRKQPEFGQVGFNLGIGNFSGKMSYSGSSTMDISSSLFAGIGIMGELWLNNEWITRAEIKQAVFSGSNPLSGSSPSKISVSVQNYSLIFGYNFLLEEDFFSSKIELRGGFANYAFNIDDTSPRGFSSMNYSGPLIGIKGSFPITKDRVWYAGADLNIFFNPVISQRPDSMGTADHNTINEYNFFVSKMVTNHLYIDGAINISYYQTQFGAQSDTRDGESASSVSFNNTFYNLGFRYQF